MRLIAGSALAVACCFVVSCGGATFSEATADGGGDGASPPGADSGVPTADAAGGSEASPPADGSQGDGAGATEGGIGFIDAAGGCPDVSGAYGSLTEEGLGCGDVDLRASQCIQVSGSCVAQFQSQSSGGSSGAAVNGDADLKGDGTFTGAALTLGSLKRSGCVGAWNAAKQTMTITCGGLASAQSCIVRMVRSNGQCN